MGRFGQLDRLGDSLQNSDRELRYLLDLRARRKRGAEEWKAKHEETPTTATVVLNDNPSLKGSSKAR
jgi:hypothetical protein